MLCFLSLTATLKTGFVFLILFLHTKCLALVFFLLCYNNVGTLFFCLVQPLVKELGLRVVPTFKIFKDNKVVKEVTGAKYDNLVEAIETARSTGGSSG